ncbi:LOW QUALITY PROTEIN: hypothetical protein CFC21_000938, partial [Triticum aestivum]
CLPQAPAPPRECRAGRVWTYLSSSVRGAGRALIGGFLRHRGINRPFYVCIENGVTCFFLWVDALAKTLMNELQEEHEEWLRMLPRTAVAAPRAPEEEMEGEACTDRELAVELRMLKKKVRKLEDQALPIPICKYFWAFVGMVIALVVMLKMYGKT